jgi:hypothetical protein
LYILITFLGEEEEGEATICTPLIVAKYVWKEEVAMEFAIL